MERWRFHIIAGDGGEPIAIRMYLRTGDDESAWPAVQVAVDGTEVPLDDVAIDYEAPEWKAIQIMTAGGGSEARWEALKEQLRAQA
ncbi:MAG: hypothetical protein R2699_12335 [Acidimicrobiales bacterium]|nr:hypothetical protein [Acidimicrobiales bacterium]MCB1260815.1 hypothetical protein [Acidimicrobiales bacterium]